MNTLGRRSAPRLRLGIPADLLTTVQGRLRVRLCNLSQDGAHVRGANLPKVGQCAFLRWLEFEVFGTVVWNANGEAGLKLDRRLSSETLVETRKRLDSGEVRSDEDIEADQIRSWISGYR